MLWCCLVLRSSAEQTRNKASTNRRVIRGRGTGISPYPLAPSKVAGILMSNLQDEVRKKYAAELQAYFDATKF